MGIRCLNRHFTQNCKKTSIEKKPLSFLKGKCIVIDISIYLYKYISQNALHENIYQMILLFYKYNITPLFVFDGKPPPEKMDLLQKRRLLKAEAEEKYYNLDDKLNNTVDNELRETILHDMEQLKRQFVRVKETDINSVKEIMDAFGVKYINAEGEADKTCAAIQLNSSNDCYGCLSDDMDMFVYGCSRIIRHFSLINETVLIYHRDDIMNDLQIPFSLFKQVAILSGTDYNIKDNDGTLFETLRWFKEFEKDVTKDTDGLCDYVFYKWLQQNTKYIKNYEVLIEIHKLFDIDININIGNVTIDPNYNKIKLQNIMSKYGFIFV